MSAEVKSDSGRMCSHGSDIAKEVDEITAKVDDIKLKECSESNSDDECPKEESPKEVIEGASTKTEIIEVTDDILFKQPESSHLGDCPICIIPLPLDISKSKATACCSKIICIGCNFANQKSEYERKFKLDPKCPFCREPIPKSEKQRSWNKRKRREANDPYALRDHGARCLQKKDYKVAFQYLSKAADLGDVTAHYYLSIMYQLGHVKEDEKKQLSHLEQAAIGGHPSARYNLGNHEWVNKRHERALRHYMIAARQGDDDTIKFLMEAFKRGNINKGGLAAALRAHQAAVDETKSPQRAEAEAAMKRFGGDF